MLDIYHPDSKAGIENSHKIQKHRRSRSLLNSEKNIIINIETWSNQFQELTVPLTWMRPAKRLGTFETANDLTVWSDKGFRK